jgi:hypothetical protein
MTSHGFFVVWGKTMEPVAGAIREIESEGPDVGGRVRGDSLLRPRAPHSWSVTFYNAKTLIVEDQRLAESIQPEG